MGIAPQPGERRLISGSSGPQYAGELPLQHTVTLRAFGSAR
jgi:hypothetical protein